MYLLSCPNCQTDLRVTPAQAGDQIVCQNCQQQVAIPKLGQLRQLPQVSQAPAESAGSSRPVGATIAFVAMSLIAVAALLGAGYNTVRWAMIETETTLDSHLERIEREYAEVEPGSMVLEFEDMEAVSLDLAMPYPYQRQADEKAKWGFNAMVAGGIMLVFATGAFIAASQGRDRRPD